METITWLLDHREIYKSLSVVVCAYGARVSEVKEPDDALR